MDSPPLSASLRCPANGPSVSSIPTAQEVVQWRIQNRRARWLGKSVDEIAAEYDLTQAGVYAALAYYFDHRAEIERSLKEGAAFVKALRRRTRRKFAGNSGDGKAMGQAVKLCADEQMREP